MKNTHYPAFETVIITYHKDFEKLQKCLQSILKHGLGHNHELIHIVVNDQEQYLKDIYNFVPQDSRFKIWHYKDIHNWSGPLDWYSQQWFKLAACKIVSSEWYLLLDSDNELLGSIKHHQMFKDHKAYYLRTSIDYANARLLKQLSFAYDYWQDTLSNHNYFMTDNIPFLIHTDTAKNMLPKVDHNIFDSAMDGTNSTLEFIFWSAYLDHMGIKHQLYHPLSDHAMLFASGLVAK